MKVSIDIDDKLNEALAGVIAKIDKRKLLDAAGAALAETATRSFREPDKRPKQWAPLAASTLKKKHGKGNTLIDTGFFVHSIVAQNNTVESINVTTGASYAGYLQYGTKKMPARPFLPFDPGMGELSEAGKIAVEDAVEAELKAMFPD